MVTTLAQRREKDAPGRGLLRDYLQLAKPRIVVLLIFTTVTAMLVAAGGAPIPIQTLLLTILGGSLAAGGSSALNQYIDRDMDGKMSRTKSRPIPAGRVAPVNALVFGLALIAWSVALLGFFVNWLSALLALIGALYYVIVYTILLKRNTVLNILIGGGAGAIPVLVGWSAVTGTLAPAAFILFAIVFYWTPPHSWALALLVNADYTRAEVPMMPVARGEEAARVQIALYSIQLVVLSLLPLPFRILGGFYLVAAIALGAGMLHEALQLLNRKSGAAARRMYKYSTFYLALLFLSMIIDTLLF